MAIGIEDSLPESCLEYQEKQETGKKLNKSEESGKPRASLHSLESMGSLLWGGADTMMSSPSTGLVATTRTGRIVTSRFFEGLTSFMIFLNCAMLGVEAHDLASSHFSEQVLFALNVCEHTFTAFFLLEFLMRVAAFGWRSLTPATPEGRSNLVDAFLAIVAGVFVTWVIPIIAVTLHFDGDNGPLRLLTMLRAIRLTRLVRVFKRVPLFKEAWLLIRGLADSCRTLFWTMVVIFFTTYAFGIFGLVTIVDDLGHRLESSKELGLSDDVARLEGLMQLFGGLDRIMFTLVQVLCGDSFYSFMRVLLLYQPWSWIYFYGYIAVACLVLMNLVTAIIVDNAMETSRNDHEQQLREVEARQVKEVKELRQLFRLMDIDGSGTLCWDEFKMSFIDETMSKKWALLDFRPDNCKELFRMLDDGDGEIELNEFFEGLQSMRGSAQAKDVFKLQRAIERIERILIRESATPMDGSESQATKPLMCHGNSSSEQLMTSELSAAG